MGTFIEYIYVSVGLHVLQRGIISVLPSIRTYMYGMSAQQNKPSVQNTLCRGEWDPKSF